MMLVSTIVLAGTLAAFDLRCEALTDPLAIQPTQPQLSWKVKAASSDLKDLNQTAYRIIVSSSPDLLKVDKGDLWDTGEVKSNETFGIRYAGKSLASRSRCWWKVKVWDQDGQDSAWSAPAYFGVGLLNPNDWQAKWIHGFKPQNSDDDLDKGNWIGPASTPRPDAPAGDYIYRFEFEGEPGDKTAITLTADNTFVLKLNGKEIHRTKDPEGWKKVVRLDLSKHAKVGINELEVTVNNASNGPTGLIAVLTVQEDTIPASASWTCNGQPAKVIGKNGAAPWGRLQPTDLTKAPAQYFRKSIDIKKPVRRAVAYVTALGNADFEINGKRASDDLFTPGWTNYDKRLHYVAHDVTKQLKRGKNELGAVLGQGWYAGYIAWAYQREHYGEQPMLFSQIEIEYADGTTEIIATDATWEVGRGPILDEHFLHGENFDARLARTDWKPVKLGSPSVNLEAFPGNPVREYDVIKPKSIQKIGEGKYQIDFGQNLSGYVRLKVKEKAGTKLTLRHAERLDKDGKIYTTNLRAAQSIDEYTCKGGGETWNPRFTFHGFQYIEVSGLNSEPTKDTFAAVAISSETPETGTLVTSDPMLNTLVKNAWWTQKMNFIDVPTDCPQRDERLGWTGDAQAYILTAAYYSDVQAFFNKWLVSLDDDQRADGQYPKVAPDIAGLDDGGPAWSDAGVICPMTIYEMYGDKALLARHYPNMKRFVEFCRKRSKPNLLPPDQYHIFGDWLSINANTPNDVITTAYFALSSKLLADAARILGHQDDAKTYDDLFIRVKAAFNEAYVTDDGKVKGETQCGYVMALAFDLLDGKRAELAAKHLVADIEKRNWHLSTGFVGTRDLMHVLSKIGRNDVAFRLLHNTTFPSWGFTIVNGATSIWERWDGWTPEKGFQDPGMNSFAHYAYGAVVGWMFKTIGGISPLEPGFGKILIAPKLDPNLKFAKTSFNSVRGLIRCDWKRVGKGVELTVEVPPNTTAEVHVPKADGSVEKKTVGSGRWVFKG